MHNKRKCAVFLNLQKVENRSFDEKSFKARRAINNPVEKNQHFASLKDDMQANTHILYNVRMLKGKDGQGGLLPMEILHLYFLPPLQFRIPHYELRIEKYMFSD